MKVLLRTPAVAPVNTAGAVQDPDFSLPGRCPQGARQRMAKAPAPHSRTAICQVKNRLPHLRDPLLAEEPVMSITAWIVRWPLDRAPVTGQADPARRPGRTDPARRPGRAPR